MSFTVIAVGDFIIRSFIFAQLTLEVAFATDLRSWLQVHFRSWWTYNSGLVKVLTFEDERQGIIACYSSSCISRECDDAALDCPVGARLCPEWTNRDVSIIAQTQLKQSVTLVAIFLSMFSLPCHLVWNQFNDANTEMRDTKTQKSKLFSNNIIILWCWSKAFTSFKGWCKYQHDRYKFRWRKLQIRT